MQKRIVSIVTASVFVLALLALPALPKVNAANSQAATIKSQMADQIRELVKSRIDTKKQEVCDKFAAKVQSKFPWVKGPSFCRGNGGGNNNLPSITITAEPMVVTAGGTSQLSWDSADANSCTASGGWSGSKSLSGTQNVTVNATTTYTLSCTNNKGTASESVTVSVIPVVVPTPTVDLNATPLAVQVGSSTELSWTSANASQCVASDGWSGSKSLSGNQSVVVSATTTYTLACGNGHATATDSVTVNATPVPVTPAPTVDINAFPLTVQAGSTSTLSWTSANASQCIASNGWSGSKSLSGSQVVTVSATTTYMLACGNGTSTFTDSVTVNTTPVPPLPTPTLTFNGSPLQITAGATSTLTWSTTNVTLCTASNGWNGSRAINGTEIVSPLATTTYVLACSGLGGTATSSVIIGVTPTTTPPAVPTVTINAAPLSIIAGATSTLTWSSTNANTCLASNAWSGSKATSSNEIVSPLATSTYVLACSGDGGTATSSVIVGVTPTTTPAPTLSFTGNPLQIIAGATSTLTWSSTDATSCTASNGWGGAKGISGNEIVSPLATTTYQLGCSGAGGATSSSVTIGVTPTSTPPTPIPTVTLNANPQNITAGATTTLTWSSTDANTCVASNGWSGSKATAGNEIFSPLSTTTYVLACAGLGGNATSSVTVGVTPTSTPAQIIGHMVISEVYYDTPTSTGEVEPGNEWFELYNGSNAGIDINGWKVRDANGSIDTLATTSTVVPAGSRILITDATSTPSFWSIPSPIIFLLSAIGNGLGNAGDALTLFDNASSTIDVVEWGNSTTTAMSPAVPTVAAGHSIGRIQFTADTDTNADWGNFAVPTPGQ